MQIMWAPEQNVLACCKPIKNFVAIFGSEMRSLFAILGLLLGLIETRAAELPVIKDSEAIYHVGKNVEVRGLVVSVRTSPLGTTLINFGRDYPNQTFAGFIPAGSKIATDRRIATLEGKIIGITGTIELFRGKPEIKVLSMNQIKVVDSHRAGPFYLRLEGAQPVRQPCRLQDSGVPRHSGALKSVVKREDLSFDDIKNYR
jgi:hypothetical protein